MPPPSAEALKSGQEIALAVMPPVRRKRIYQRKRIANPGQVAGGSEAALIGGHPPPTGPVSDSRAASNMGRRRKFGMRELRE